MKPTAGKTRRIATALYMVPAVLRNRRRTQKRAGFIYAGAAAAEMMLPGALHSITAERKAEAVAVGGPHSRRK